MAYVALADEPALVAFGAAFNGRGFTHVPPTPPDGEDAPPAPVEPPKEYRASVEYAPWQKTPRARPRRDRREGTLERDPEYLAFLAELEAGPKVSVSAETLLDRRESERAAEARVNGGRAPVKMSALLKYLAAKRAKERRIQLRQGNRRRSRHRRDEIQVQAPQPTRAQPPRKGRRQERETNIG